MRKITLGKLSYVFELKENSLKRLIITKVIDAVVISASVGFGLILGDYLYNLF